MNRSTIILIAVLLVLGGIVLIFYGPFTSEEREASYQAGQLSLSIDSASIIRIELRRPAKSIIMENVGGRWMVTTPVHYPADPVEVNRLISGFVRFKSGSLISSNPEKQQIFEVDSSSGTRLTMTDRTGKSASLIVGKMGPSYSEIYFRVPSSKDVYLGEGLESWTVTRDVKDWRDKNILLLPADSIRAVTYTAGAKEYAFTKDTSGWHLGGQKIESAGIAASVNSIAALRADDFLDSATTIPSHPVTVTVKAPLPVSVSIAPMPPDTSKYYVQVSSSPQIFLVSKWTGQQLLKPIEKQVPPPTQKAAAHPPAVASKAAPSRTPVTVPPKTAKPSPPSVAKTQTQGTTTFPVPVPAKGARVERKQKPKVTQEVSQDTSAAPPAPPPVQKTEQPPATETKTVPPQSAQQNSALPEDEGDLTVYTVKKGETMQTIAKRYNVSVEQILKWNLLKSISVKPGQELYIYIKK
ncbi:MAG TPA: DUF4340 domain-containing protein [Bacteroidota bacterium]|nr:DUF4340 domain-containing protein [Bacteroidota bacterium]